jgi:tetratricopeptide (TPR) repeat protein
MLNIIDLEKRWFRYKVKSYIPHAIIVFSILIILSIILLFTTQDNNVKPKVKKPPVKTAIVVQKSKVVPVKIKEIEKKPVTIIPKQIIVPKTVSHKVVKYKEASQVKLSPSLDFMKKMQDSMQPYYKNEPTNGRYRPVQKERTSDKEVKAVRKKELQKREEKQPVSIKKIRIKRQNTQNDIFEIIERFKKNNNPALSLFVAKKYYELGEYKQSYNYALITNEINKDIESSWIIFSKSLVKLGKKEKAIKTLTKYVKQSHSNAAKILLDEIRSGKFR